MSQTCPTPETLRGYLTGQYSPEQVDELESHLETCAACEQTISWMEGTKDSLMRHLPVAATDDGSRSTSPPWLQQIASAAGAPELNVPVAKEPVAKDSEERDTDAPPNPIFEDFGVYELTGLLGRGGMGVVYRARHRQLGREVAIKVVDPKLVAAGEAHERFGREIQVLGKLNHPGIVMATDAGKIGAASYLVMESIDGVNLGQLVRAVGPLPIGLACEVARQVADALSAAHDAGAIHRDVKPSNVMMDRTGQTKLLDFGLAFLAEVSTEHTETSLGRLLGTLDYIAPEQAAGERVDHAADWYGLGATLFYLLTGRPPHGARGNQNVFQRLQRLANEPPPILSEHRADIPAKLSELVTSLLDRKPDARPGNASEVAEKLGAWVEPDAANQLAELIPDIAKPANEQDIARSLSLLLGEAPTHTNNGSLNVNTLAVETIPSRKRKWLAGLVAIVFLAAVLATLIIYLDTPDGRVRIESDLEQAFQVDRDATSHLGFRQSNSVGIRTRPSLGSEIFH